MSAPVDLQISVRNSKAILQENNRKQMVKFDIYTIYPLCKRREIVYNNKYYGYVAFLELRSMIKAGDGKL